MIPALTRRALTAGALLTPSLVALPAFAFQDDGAELGRAVVTLFEPSTTAEVRAAFWRDRLSGAGRDRTPLEAFDASMRGVAELTGGVELLDTRAVPSGSRAGTAFLLRARRQGTTRWVRMVRDRDDPTRLFDVAGLPLPAPYDREGPTGPVSREQLALEIERRVRYAVERGDFSGAGLVTAPDGAVIWQGAFDLADADTGRTNTLDTPFHLGSADKSFTALLTGGLIREGRLSLDTPLIEVLPDYPNAAFARACTIDHLLSHTSGLGGLFDRAGYDVQAPYQRMTDMFPAFADQPPAFAPGERAAYSNEGFVVLGAVIEAVSGRSWYDLLAERIHGPVGMTSSGHLRRDEAVGVKAVGQTWPDSDRLGFGPRVRNDHIVGYRGNSCGGGYSTVADMTRYLRALWAGQIMPAEQLPDFITARPGGLPQYGRGFQSRSVGGRTLVGHGGGGARSGIDGYHAVVWETGWTISFLGNNDAPFTGELTRDIGGWLALQEG